MTELVSVDVQSPFDSIRKVRPDGTEYWTGRDLNTLTNYASWQKFENAIDRATAAINNLDMPLTSHVNQVGNLVARPQGGSILMADYELSRYAAYLVMINGDPRKPEIAAAQSYFAIKTREAELVQSQIPQTYAEALREAAALHERALQAEAAALEANTKVVELEPLAAEYERFLDAEGTLKMGGVANMFGIGRTTLFKHLKEEGVLQPDRRPYQQYADWFRVIPHGYKNSKAEDRMAFTGSS
ncbi:MAG: phage antirepressor KilAC domain-containing protein [Rhodococcus erythropolis]